jgi:two-component system, LytTR family, sensor kinase
MEPAPTPASPAAPSDPPAEAPARLRDLMSPTRLVLGGFAFWSGVALVFAIQDSLVFPRAGIHLPFHRLLVAQLASWWSCALLTPAIVAGTLRIRASRPSAARGLLLHAPCAAAFVVLGGSLMGVLETSLPWSHWQHGPAAAAVDGMLRYLGFDLLLYILVVLATEAAANALESRRRGIAASTYARQLAEARLHVLSAQLQPHFLFNTLHAVSALVWEDQARAERLLARLSEMLRLTLRNGGQVETTLDEEMALLHRYAEIQETRYGERLQVRFDIEARVRDAMVPRLILQPLVENAIRHGITRRITPGRVDVRAWQDAGRLHLVVSDDGVGLGARGPRREGVGLSITRARLRQLYGAAQRFELSAAPRGGTVCAMAIPLRTATATPAAG